MGRLEEGPGARRRNARLAGLGTALSAAVLVTGVVTGTGATVSAATTPGTAAPVTNLSDPTAGHGYRHGAVPRRLPAGPGNAATAAPPRASAGARSDAGPSTRNELRYGGGPVVTSSPKVYLVFWGSQWGTESTGAGGYQAFSGDPDGLAPNLQAFFSGLGTDNELWSAILTQYCQGVTPGAKSCSISATSGHVPYPRSRVLGGVWGDPSVTLPAASATQIAQEAANAAVHFSNPPGAQYVIVSPTGTDPDGWLDPVNGYCAYHDNAQDPMVGGVSGADVPYTNMPYVPDVGGQCSSFANPGTLDGADETMSHEYAETVTDPFPVSGWSDRFQSEIGDKCENLVGGQPGGSVYETLATGTFVLQGLWANDVGKRGGCESAHSPVLTVNPGKQKTRAGTAVSLQIGASDVLGESLTYAATGLPTGLVINSTSGLVSGVAEGRGRSTVTVVVSSPSASATVVFLWTLRR
jgi:serine protease